MSATLPSWSSSQLSSEIHDMIIDNLHSSKKDLSNCSTVCTSWLPASRHHLFAEVNFRPDFARLLAGSTHAADTISPHIRKVKLNGPILAYDEENVLEDLILRLPGLLDLHINHLGWKPLGRPMATTDPSFQVRVLDCPSFCQISRLSFQSVHFPSFSELARFLDLFMVLEELSLENVTWDHVGGCPEEVVSGSILTPKHSFLNKLRVEFCHNRVILNWLHYGFISDSIPEQGSPPPRGHFPRLRNVSIPDILSCEAYVLGDFLTGLGESLEVLEIGITVHDFYAHIEEDSTKSLSLLNCSKLKEINIHQITLFQFPSQITHHAATSTNSPSLITLPSPYAWITSFLSTVPLSTDVQAITFHIWLSSEPQLDMISWANLANVLVGIRASRLRFQISGVGRDTDVVVDWFKKRLRAIDEDKTVLEFRFCG